jgi:hypothetical protein
MKSLKELEVLSRNEIREYFQNTKFSKEELLDFLKLSGIRKGSIKQLTWLSCKMVLLLTQK